MLNKSELLLVIILFYAFLSVFMGMIGNSLNMDLGEQSNTIDNKISVIDNVITGYTAFEWWVTVLIFTPLISVLGFVLISSLPTFNGGG